MEVLEAQPAVSLIAFDVSIDNITVLTFLFQNCSRVHIASFQSCEFHICHCSNPIDIVLFPHKVYVPYIYLTYHSLIAATAFDPGINGEEKCCLYWTYYQLCGKIICLLGRIICWLILVLFVLLNLGINYSLGNISYFHFWMTFIVNILYLMSLNSLTLDTLKCHRWFDNSTGIIKEVYCVDIKSVIIDHNLLYFLLSDGYYIIILSYPFYLVSFF